MSSQQHHFSDTGGRWRHDSDYAQTAESPLAKTSSEDSVEVAADDLANVESRASQPPLASRVTSVCTTGTTDPDYEVDWEEKDPENPRNWPLWYRGVIVGFLSWNTWVV